MSSNNDFFSSNTPALVLSTYLGNLLHTTPDLLLEMKHLHSDCSNNDRFTFFGQLDYHDLVEKAFVDIPIDQLYLSNDDNVTTCSSRSSSRGNRQKNIFATRSLKSGSFVEGKAYGLSIKTHKGYRKVTVDDFYNRIVINKPEIVIAMADELPFKGIGYKRQEKAVERTDRWLNELMAKEYISNSVNSNDLFLFGVALLSPIDIVNREVKSIGVSISNLLLKGVNGIVVGGAFLGNNDDDDDEYLYAIVKEAKTSLSKHGSVPLLVQGASRLDQIIALLELGVDVISTDYSSVMSSMSKAIIYNDVCAATSGKKRSYTPSDDSCTIDDQALKKSKLSTDTCAVSDPKAAVAAVETTTAVSTKHSNLDNHVSINLSDERHRTDPQPILSGCMCHTCKNGYSRAYLYHLLKSKEMLAEVLIYSHNQHTLLNIVRSYGK